MKKIISGNNVLISWDSSIMDSDFQGIFYEDDNMIINPPKITEVSDDV